MYFFKDNDVISVLLFLIWSKFNTIFIFFILDLSVQIRSFFWSVFSRIRTEYRDLLRKSPYSVRLRENTDQKKLRIWTLFTQCWPYKWAKPFQASPAFYLETSHLIYSANHDSFLHEIHYWTEMCYHWRYNLQQSV